MNKIILYLQSFYQFAKNSLYHTLILITFIITTLISIWIYTTDFINLITAITAILALFIWFGDLNRSWRGSLKNRLTIFYLAPEKELYYNTQQNDNSAEKSNILACYVRANVVGNSDIRAFSQQLAVQLITQYIESLQLVIKRPPIRLKLDIGGIDVHHHPNPIYLKDKKGNSAFVNDIIVIVKLNKFVSDLEKEWCPEPVSESIVKLLKSKPLKPKSFKLKRLKPKLLQSKLLKSKLLGPQKNHFIFSTVGIAAADNEALTTLDELDASEKYAPFSHIIECIKNELN